MISKTANKFRLFGLAKDNVARSKAKNKIIDGIYAGLPLASLIGGWYGMRSMDKRNDRLLAEKREMPFY